MKVAIFEGAGVPLRIDTRPEPVPAADEVVLRVAACGICDSDLHITEDPKPFGISAGFVLGHEFAGEVVAMGATVTTLASGDRVAVVPMRGCGHCATCLRGDPARCAGMTLIGCGYAEYVTVAARQCHILPEGVALADGALAEPLSVALHCIVRSGMRPGDRVAIIGAGPIGLLVALWARRMGAAKVVMADVHTISVTAPLAWGPRILHFRATVWQRIWPICAAVRSISFLNAWASAAFWHNRLMRFVCKAQLWVWVCASVAMTGIRLWPCPRKLI